MGINTIILQERPCGRDGKAKVFQICVPKWIAKSLGWKKGDILSIKKGHNCMNVKKSGSL